MKRDRIEQYLADVKGHLWWMGLADLRTLEEIESHLSESVDDGLDKGLNLEEAQAQALNRFGPARRVAAQFARGRMTFMQKILLVAGVIGGLFFAYIDSLPKFDDTGILAFGILIFAGLLGLLGCRRPWLLALVVGTWVPLHDILVSGNFGALLAVLFALAGAYSGWGVNRLIRKNWRPV